MSDPIGDMKKAIEELMNTSHYERVELHHPRCDMIMGLGPCSCIPMIQHVPVKKKGR